MRAKQKEDILERLKAMTPKSPSIARKRARMTIMEELLLLVPERPKSDSTPEELIEKLDIPSSPQI